MSRKERTESQLGTEFRGLWFATAAANLADGAVLALLPLMALSLTTAPGPVAAVTVAGTAAWAIVGLPAGWLVDVVDRRRLLLFVNAGRTLFLAILMIAALLHQLSLPIVLALALLLGVGEVLADSAFTALVPEVVPPRLRGRANARVETTVNVLNQLVGPPLAGVLVGFGLGLATGGTAALYALAVPGLAFLGRRNRAGRECVSRDPGGSEHRSWRIELTAGLRLLGRDRRLRTLTGLTAGMNVVWGAWGALFVLYAVTPGPLGLTPAGYGLLLAGMAVGGIAVAPAIDAAVRRFGVRSVLIADLVGTVFLVAPAAGGLGLGPVALGMVLAGAGATVWRTVVATLRQNLVPASTLGRVYSASRLVSWGVVPLGAAGAGLVAQAASVRTAFTAATILAVAALIGFVGGFRHPDLDRPYAQAVPPTSSPPRPGRGRSDH